MKRRQLFCSRIGTTLLFFTDFARARYSRESSGKRRKWGTWVALLAVPALGGFGLHVLSRELIAGVPGPSQGGIFYVVNTTSDTVVVGACQNGDAGCSLRGAIQVANSHPGDDGIGIDLPAGSVINLTGVLPDLTEGVSISGPGANLLTVRRDTGGSYRIFNLTTTGFVTFSGLTISNGQGGINNNNAATVNVINCVLSDNSTASGLGGGIYNNSTGTVNVTDSTLSGNSAGSGGGIYNNSTGTVSVTHSFFGDNTATGVPGDGGAIANRSTGTLNVTNSLIRDNNAYTGGGIFNSGTVNITGSTLFSNHATASGVDIASGGGIFNSGTVNVTNSTISLNGATTRSTASSHTSAGGGIYNSSSTGTMNVINSTLSSNFAGPFNSNTSSVDVCGGGIFNDTGTVNVTNSTLVFNDALADGNRSARGAGIFNDTGTVNITNSTLSNNLSAGGSASATHFGGGIFNRAGVVKARSTIIALNRVDQGGSTGGSNPDASGPFTSQGFNLIGKTDGSTGFTAPTDQTGTVAAPLDPKLDPSGPQNNGGPTETIALLFGSPAIDKGSGEVQPGLFLLTDQRGAGFARTFDDPATPNATGGDGTDIGAFELQTAPPTVFGNISTRLRVETGDNVLIGGFIITGTQPKKVIVRAIGPSLPLAGALADPVLELHGPGAFTTITNDNWRSDQEAEIIATTIPPSNDLESAIVATLPANSSAYTAIVRGVNNGTGIGLVEAYDLDQTVDSKLANISTRGFVQTGDDVLIGGLIVLGQNPLRVIVRAIGPSLPVPGALGDPTLELHDGNGALIASNNNWRSDQEAEIIATTIPPSSDLESAIVRTLAPGNYTAIVRGVNSTTGIAVVEAYGLN